VAHALGIDVGGSGIKGAVVDTTSGKILSKRLRVPSPTEFTVEKVVQTIAELAGELGEVDSAGIAFPAVVREGVVSSRPTAFLHRGWRGVDLTRELSIALGSSCATINDADAVALAEAELGLAAGVAGTVLVCTLGSGIGSGLLSNGQLIPNIEVGGLFLPGHDSNVEQWTSSRVRKVEDLSWREWGDRLNALFTHLERVFAPDLIVIGGGVSKKHEKFLRYIKVSCRITPSTFTNDAGIVGAALLGARSSE
jgi:polyphosphate glucokinase